MREVKTITWSSKQLASMFDKETIRFDSYVQRHKCWDNKRKSLLVRTVLNGFPRVPEIYATKDTDNKIYQCLDGQQRLTTMFDFMRDKIILDEIDPVVDDDGNEYELTGKTYSELPELLQDIIKTYSWRVAYYDDLTEDEQAEMFYLINNAKPLSSIEHMRCLSPSLRIIQKIGEHELFTTSLTEKAFERYAHEDLVIKSYVMLTHKTPCLDNKTIRPTMETAVFTEEDINNLNAVYDRILEVYKEVIADTSTETGKLSKKVAKRVITKTHMLSIIPIVKKSLDDNVSIELFTAWVKNFFCGTKSPTKYDKYNNKATSGSGHIEAVKARLDVIKTDYAKFMKEHANDVFEKEDTKAEAVEEKMETVETVSEEITETIVETEVETVEVTPEMVEATETTEEVIEMANRTEVEEINVAEKSTELTEEDDIPESVRAILEAAEMEEDLAEAI